MNTNPLQDKLEHNGCFMYSIEEHYNEDCSRSTIITDLHRKLGIKAQLKYLWSSREWSAAIQNSMCVFDEWRLLIAFFKLVKLLVFIPQLIDLVIGGAEEAAIDTLAVEDLLSSSELV